MSIRCCCYCCCCCCWGWWSSCGRLGPRCLRWGRSRWSLGLRWGPGSSWRSPERDSNRGWPKRILNDTNMHQSQNLEWLFSVFFLYSRRLGGPYMGKARSVFLNFYWFPHLHGWHHCCYIGRLTLNRFGRPHIASAWDRFIPTHSIPPSTTLQGGISTNSFFK